MNRITSAREFPSLFLGGPPFFSASCRGHGPSAQLPVVRRIPGEKSLVLLVREFDVPHPFTYRGHGDPDSAGDLLDRKTFLLSQTPGLFPLFRFHFRKQATESADVKRAIGIEPT